MLKGNLIIKQSYVFYNYNQQNVIFCFLYIEP